MVDVVGLVGGHTLLGVLAVTSCVAMVSSIGI